jgi:hypothetical protein
MIPFFRKIRKKMADDNKPLKYMRYAIGEIVLVVLGILIALQINNWNEQNKSDTKTKAYLLEIQRDLFSDVLEINYIMDYYVILDSIETAILNNKIVFDIETDYESMILTYLYATLPVHTNGFDGLTKNSDNLPYKYLPILNDLNDIYITTNKIVDLYNGRIQSTVYANLDNLKNKEWSVFLWQRKNNKAMTSYFLSDAYKSELMNYMNDLRDHIGIDYLYKTQAIEAYRIIDSLIESENEIPKEINTSLKNPDMLNHYAGHYTLMENTRPIGGNKTYDIIVNNGRLFSHGNELFWHNSGTFFLSYYILDFEMHENGQTQLKINDRGSIGQYVKKKEG